MTTRILDACTRDGKPISPVEIVRGFAQVGLKVEAREKVSGPCTHAAIGRYRTRSYQYYLVGGKLPFCFIENDLEEASLKRHKLHLGILRRYHMGLLKSIHSLLSSQLKEPVWILIGGGMQVQAFFGCEDEYVAILYLHLSNEKPKAGGSYNLFVNNKRNNKLFHPLTIPNIAVVPCKT